MRIEKKSEHNTTTTEKQLEKLVWNRAKIQNCLLSLPWLVFKDLQFPSGGRVLPASFGTISSYQRNSTNSITNTKTTTPIRLKTFNFNRRRLSREPAPAAELAPIAPEKYRRRSSLRLPDSLHAASAPRSEKHRHGTTASRNGLYPRSIERGRGRRVGVVAGDGERIFRRVSTLWFYDVMFSLLGW